jgi:hypothetical protein
MAMVSQERILDCLRLELTALASSRQKQLILIEFAEKLGFSLRNADQALQEIIVFGGSVGPGDVWPMGWMQAQPYLSAEQVQKVKEAYLRIVDEFPQYLKEGHATVFVDYPSAA